jgi:hypothetical protein
MHRATAALPPVTAAQLGFTAAELGDMADAALKATAPSAMAAADYARNAVVDDALAPSSSAVIGAIKKEARKKEKDTLHATPTAATRAGVFLRGYADHALGDGGANAGNRLPDALLKEVSHFCATNDPVWVSEVQALALKALLSVMAGDDRAASPVPASSAATKAAAALQTVAALPAMQQLQRSPRLAAGAAPVPRVGVGQLHHTYHATGDDAEMYFSTQVRIANDGKLPFAVGVSQQMQLGAEGNDAGAFDFHVIADKSVVGKGEAATIVMSLIVRDFADFSAVEHIVVVNVGDGGVKLFLTLSVVNPHGAVFGVPFPLACCCPAAQQSPLGVYGVPVVLAALQQLFNARNGFAAFGVHPAGPFDATGTLGDFAAVKLQLDEHGHTPLLARLTMSALPAELALLTPSQMMWVAVLWITELPVMLITPGILASADALRYLTEEIEAEAQGVVLWVLDFMCQAVAASPTPAVTRMELIRVLAPVLAAGGLTALLRAGGRSQFETAVDLERATADHMACWVTAFVGRYQR